MKRWLPAVAVLVFFAAPWTQLALERFPAFFIPGAVVWIGVFVAMLAHGALLRTVRKLAAGAATFLLAVLLLQGDYIAVALTLPEQGDALILDRMGVVEGASVMIVVAALAFGIAEYRVWKVDLALQSSVVAEPAATAVHVPAHESFREDAGTRNRRGRWLPAIALAACAVALIRRG